MSRELPGQPSIQRRTKPRNRAGARPPRQPGSRLTGAEGRTIRVLYAPYGDARPVAGDAIKSYGLCINGVEVASPDAALSADRLLCYFFFPLFGIGLGVFGDVRARYMQRASMLIAYPVAIPSDRFY
jgi:hypothetical protein